MKLTSERRNLLEAATARYQRAVHLARAYLEGRGFTEATVVSFRLGVVDDPVPGDEQYAGRLAIPYLSRAGVVDLRYRCLADHVCGEQGCPKYLGRAGGSTHLYNVGALFRPEPFVCLTEGELDTVALTQCGLPSVGVAGAQGFKAHYRLVLDDYPTKYVFGDGDEPGRKFADHLARETAAVKIAMPEGMDVNDVLLDPAYGKEWIIGRIRPD